MLQSYDVILLISDLNHLIQVNLKEASDVEAGREERGETETDVNTVIKITLNADSEAG